MELIIALLLLPIIYLLLPYAIKLIKEEIKRKFPRNGVNLLLFTIGLFISSIILIYNYFKK